MARRAADDQEGDQSLPEATREIPFHSLGARVKSRAFCAEFDIMRNAHVQILSDTRSYFHSGSRCPGIT